MKTKLKLAKLNKSANRLLIDSILSRFEKVAISNRLF